MGFRGRYGYRGGRGQGAGWGGGPPFMNVNLPSLQPPPQGGIRIAVATMDDKGLSSVIAPRFARAPFMTIIDVVQGKVISVRPISNPFSQVPRGAGSGLGQWLLSIGTSVVIGPHVGPNLGMILQQAGVRIELVPPGTPVIYALRKLGIMV